MTADANTPNGIPVARWVGGTIQKMVRARTVERRDWARFWFDTYRELGGTSRTSGTKGCPRSAAYGLWFLGRVAGADRPRLCWPLQRVMDELGRNAAYAILAMDFASEARGELTQTWQQVQQEFRKSTGKEPARSEQGEVRLALALREFPALK